MDKREVIALGYCRFSPRPNAKECDSSDVQLADIRRYCERMGYTLPDNLIFRDDDKSGRSTHKRPGLQAAMKAMRPGMVFVARDLKRLGRSLELFPLIVSICRRKVRIELLHDGVVDLNDPDKLVVIGIKGVLGAVERLRISIDTKEKMRRHQANGRRMSDISPFGYARDPEDGKRLLPFDVEQATIARMQELHLNYGYRAVGRALEREGLLCRGRKWNHRTVSRILEREAAKAKELRRGLPTNGDA